MTSDGPFRFSPRSHRADAIGWREWGTDAFEEAQRAERLVLLAVTNAWSEPCLAVDESLWSDEAVHELVRERFLPLRVDADDRPDIAIRYTTDGAPAVALLTPEGDVIARAEETTREALEAAAETALEAWGERREELLRELEAERAMRAAERATAAGRRQPGLLTPAILDVALEVIEETPSEAVDARAAAQVVRLWRYAHLRRGTPGARDRALNAAWGLLAAGHFSAERGGVVHRAGDGALTAADQGAMLLALADLALMDPGEDGHEADVELREAFREPARRIVAFVTEVLGEPNGGIRHAQPAGSADAIDERAIAWSTADVARGLIAAGVAFGERAWIERGRRAVDFLIEHLRAGDAGYYHCWTGRSGGLGYLDDQAHVLLALLQAYEVSGAAHYLEQGRVLARLMERDWQEPGRGFRDVGMTDWEIEEVGLLTEPLLPLDGNVAAAEAFLWLARLTHDERYLDIASEALAGFASGLERLGAAIAPFAHAVDRMLSAEPEVKVISEHPPGDPDQVADPLFEAALRLPVAGRTVQRLTVPRDDGLIYELDLPTGVVRSAFVCLGGACSAALTQTEQLMPAIEEMIESPA